MTQSVEELQLENTLENKKFFELKNKGYRDGIKERRQDRDGIAHLE